MLHKSNCIDAEILKDLTIKRPETPYSDGPPCIELMVQNRVGEGGRNNALFHYGVYAKSKWPQNWKSKIILFNEDAMEHPLSDTEAISKFTIKTKKNKKNCNN